MSETLTCPKCGGDLRRVNETSEPEGIRRDARCLTCDRRYMVTKGGLSALAPAPTRDA